MTRKAGSPPHLVTLILLTAPTALSLNMFLPSLPKMAGSYSTSYETISLAIAGYPAVTAVLRLVMDPLSDRFGRRPVLLLSLAIFVVASLGCIFADTVGNFLLFRAGQCVVIAGRVLSLAVVRDTRSEREAASLIGYIAMAVAPMVGGGQDELFGRRSNFVLLAVFGSMLLAVCLLDFGETNENPSSTFGAQFRTYPELCRSRRFGVRHLHGVVEQHVLCVSRRRAAGFGRGSRYANSGTRFLHGNDHRWLHARQLLSGRYSGRFTLTTMMIAGRAIACAGLVAGAFLVLSGSTSVLSLFGAPAASFTSVAVTAGSEPGV